LAKGGVFRRGRGLARRRAQGIRSQHLAHATELNAWQSRQIPFVPDRIDTASFVARQTTG